MKSGYVIIAVVVLAGILGALLHAHFVTPAVKIVERTVEVPLPPEKLRELELAIELRVKGEQKPVFRYVKDSSEVKKLFRELQVIKDSLLAIEKRDSAQINLPLSWGRDSLGTYGDTLHVSADCLKDTISVVFKPRYRQFTQTVRDTIIASPKSSLWRDVAIFLGGVITDSVVRSLVK